MNTVFLLMAQYGARAIIPIEDVCRDYFAPLTLPNLMRKISAGDIALPLVRMDKSQKTAKGVYIMDLALYIDKQRAVAVKEYETFHGRKWVPD
ncbi:pyocin activator PrtN family protein [Burkholderia sp. BCC1998]|uniref:pyocin activator PrtN family protein n=1 Tax=Burkholderia sp. BCC1998 TaxID=2817447 RepID=UPI002AB7A7D1|nr:pyocin activator PrtN family protein [Burkholderia sp. BCC1998]